VPFDCDIHLHEDLEALARCCASPWSLALEQEGAERLFDTPGYTATAPIDPIKEVPDPPRFLSSPDTLHAWMEESATDGVLLLPDRLMTLPATNNAEYAVAIAEAYNRDLIERWVDPVRGRLGALLVAPQDPVAAAAEIRRAGSAPGVAAVVLSTALTSPPWGDPWYEPIYRAMAETDLPGALHGADTYGTLFPYQTQMLASPLARAVLTHPFAAMTALANLIGNGVLDRYPLRLLICEAGLLVATAFLGRLSGRAALLPEAVGTPHTIVDRVRERLWWTTHPMRDVPDGADGALASVVGHSRIVFGSNAPHLDEENRASLMRLSRGIPDFARILDANATRLLHSS